MSDEIKTTKDIDLIKWPEHKCNMHIDHNQHLAYYETVESALSSARGSHPTYDRRDFPDETEIQKAIATGEVWTIQWYPETPIGFCRVCAATLSRALEHAANG